MNFSARTRAWLLLVSLLLGSSLTLGYTALAGCATPRPASDDPAVYRPAHPIHYPAQR